MTEGIFLDRDIVSELLNPVSKTVFQSEEDRHPWRPHYFQIFDKPFLRLWDHCSGSQTDENGCMQSRAERARLDTIESRKDSLTIHINHKCWRPTPYISFTTLPSQIEDLANLRAHRNFRGPHTLTVVDPNIRVRKGLPVLHVSDEMKHYGIADPYEKSNEYYEDHYICLWEVTKREIIGHWQWNDLIVHENWYQEIIMPAFRQAGREVVEADNLSNLFARLLLATDPSEPTTSSNRLDSSSDELGCFPENEYDDFDDAHGRTLDEVGSDTDDEVERIHAIDDMAKTTQGN